MKKQIRPERSLEFYQKKKRHTTLYSTSIIAGICIAIYIYAFSFDYYSETTLVKMTALWVFPIVFGYYGFVAQWMQENFEQQKYRKPTDLLLSFSMKLPLIIKSLFNILHLPLFVPKKSPLFLAISGALIWSIWLFIFFVVIFPLL